MTSLRALAPLIVLIAASVVSACGGDDEAAAPSADDLDGRSFVATSIEGQTIVEGSEIVVSFEDGMILIEAGCNSQRGGFEIDEDGSLVAGQLAATMMACDEALMAQDQLLAEIVADGPTVTLDEDQMTLTTDSTTVALTERD